MFNGKIKKLRKKNCIFDDIYVVSVASRFITNFLKTFVSVNIERRLNHKTCTKINGHLWKKVAIISVMICFNNRNVITNKVLYIEVVELACLIIKLHRIEQNNVYYIKDQKFKIILVLSFHIQFYYQLLSQ